MIEERLAELGIELPPAPQPVASYIPVKVVGDLAWVAAQVPMQDGAVTVAGSAGANVTTEEATAGARGARSRRSRRSARRSGAWIA